MIIIVKLSSIDFVDNPEKEQTELLKSIVLCYMHICDIKIMLPFSSD